MCRIDKFKKKKNNSRSWSESLKGWRFPPRVWSSACVDSWDLRHGLWKSGFVISVSNKGLLEILLLLLAYLFISPAQVSPKGRGAGGRKRNTEKRLLAKARCKTSSEAWPLYSWLEVKRTPTVLSQSHSEINTSTEFVQWFPSKTNKDVGRGGKRLALTITTTALVY